MKNEKQKKTKQNKNKKQITRNLFSRLSSECSHLVVSCTVQEKNQQPLQKKVVKICTLYTHLDKQRENPEIMDTSILSFM